MESKRREILHCVAKGKDVFGGWLEALRDVLGRAAILKRLDRVEEGDLGDHRFVVGGVWELRVHVGPGYRIYYGEDGPTVILLLCGGSKRTQKKDISKATRLWAGYRRLQ